MEIKIMITINRKKRDILRERCKELGIIPSVVTIYGILRLLDMLDGALLSDVDRRFCEFAINEYRPREIEIDKCGTSMSFPDYIITRSDLTNHLSKYGLLLTSLCKAFYNTLLKCDIDSIPQRSAQDGFLLSFVSSRKVFSLKNKSLNTCLRLSDTVSVKLEKIAKEAETSAYCIIARIIDILIAIEFEKDVFINNSNIISENILIYNKKTTSITGCNRFYFSIRKIDKSVRILVLLEKYGIPGIAELLYRIIRFILLSHSGEISLSRIHTNDDSDYNETRMIRNEFRKEVLYAATR